MAKDNTITEMGKTKFSIKNDLLKIIVISIIYFAAQRIAFFFPDSEKLIMLIWPAGGIALAALLLTEKRWWPVLISFLFLSGMISNTFFTDRTFLAGIGYMVANMVETTLSAWLIMYVSNNFKRFTQTKEVMALFASGLLVNALSSCIGAATSVLAYQAEFFESWKSWFISDSLGILLVCPFIVAWSDIIEYLRKGLSIKKIIEGTACLIIWVIFSLIVFSYPKYNFGITIHPYFLVALIAWPSIRFGLKGITLCLIVLFVIAIHDLSIPNGPAIWGLTDSITSSTSRLIDLQVFLEILAISGYLLATTFTELITTKKILIENNKQLILAKEKIEKSEEKFRKAFYTNPEAITINRIETGTYVSVNNGFVRMLEYTEKEAIGHSSIELNIWQNAADRTTFVDILKKEGIIESFETTLRSKSGKIIDCLVSSVVIELENIPHILSITRDISYRKRVENELRESKEQLNFAFEGSNDGLWDVNMKTGDVYINARGCEILGYLPNEMEEVAKVWSDLVHPDDLPVTNSNLQAHIENKTPVFEVEQRLRMKSGDWKWILSRGKVVSRDADGLPLRMTGTHTDISEQVAFKEALIYKNMELESSEEEIRAANEELTATYEALKESNIELEIAKEKAEKSEKIQKSLVSDLNKAQRIAQMGNWELNIETNELFWSDEIYKIFDCDPQEFNATYEVFLEFIHPEDREKVDSAYSKSLETKKEYQIEHRIITKKNQIKYAKEKCNTTFSEQGKPLTSFGIIIDITAQKALENDLRNAKEKAEESELQLKESQRVSRLGSYSWDLATGLWNSSDILDEIFGIDENYVRSLQGWVDIIHTDWKEFMNNYVINEVLGKHHRFDKEYKITRIEDGKELWVHGQGELMLDEQGNPIKLYGTIQDINRRKLAEEVIKENEQKLNALFSSMTEMVAMHELVFNKNGEPVNYRITDCNLAYTQITGIKKEDAVGKLATELYGTEKAPYLDEYTQVAISGIPHMYNTYFAPMDKHFSISVVSPKKNQFATITTDITAIQQIHEVITAKNKELENYLYVSSHDLRSPLVNIQGFSQRLLKQINSINELLQPCELEPELKTNLELVTGKQIPESLNFIFTSVAKMDVLIASLLQISRVGRVKMDIMKINTELLFQNILSMLNYQLTDISATVLVEKLPYCYGDENTLNQLFTNILNNAIKYRKPNVPLKIKIEGKTMYNKVTYSITDNGIGMETKYLKKIWDVFYRIDSTKESGEGIGLSISKRIVDKHKGKIWV